MKTSFPAVSQNDVLREKRAAYNIIPNLPRIPPNTTLDLIAKLEDPTRFNNNKQPDALVCIDIRRFQSNKTVFKNKIHTCGSKHLQKLLSSSSRTGLHNNIMDKITLLRMMINEKRNPITNVIKLRSPHI